MRNPIRLALLASLLLPLAGCYVLHTATGQWSVMQKRRPIPEVIANPATEATVRQRLEQVLLIREFAIRELGLPDNGSYRSYADIKRPYVVWNVFATPEFSVVPERWCFPIAGCVNYRGYFNEKKARSFAEKLRSEGRDVQVGGTTAYSTLGHFADPVLNTMLAWSEAQLAATLFHELTHQLIYVPGDSEFNEALASVVEEEGLNRWLRKNGRMEDFERYRIHRQRYTEVTRLMSKSRERLRVLYAGALPESAMRQEKGAIIMELKAEYTQLKQTWGGGSFAFDSWFTGEINNAHLVSIATYQDCVPGLQALLARDSGELPAFYSRMRGLAKMERGARHALVCSAPATGK